MSWKSSMKWVDKILYEIGEYFIEEKLLIHDYTEYFVPCWIIVKFYSNAIGYFIGQLHLRVRVKFYVLPCWKLLTEYWFEVIHIKFAIKIVI